MPTIIKDGKLFVSVKEVMALMDAFKRDMQDKREQCLLDIERIPDLNPVLEEVAVKITHQDYDYFIECLESNLKNYQQMVISASIKHGIPPEELE